MCGEKLGYRLHLACVGNLMYVLDGCQARIDTFQLRGNKSGRPFAFPVIPRARQLTCGPEEVYVMSLTKVVVYSALDGTQLRTLSPVLLSQTLVYCLAYSPTGTLVISPVFLGFGKTEKNCSVYCIQILSPADGTLLRQIDFCDVESSDVVCAWDENSDLWAVRGRWSEAAFTSSSPFKLN